MSSFRALGINCKRHVNFFSTKKWSRSCRTVVWRKFLIYRSPYSYACLMWQMCGISVHRPTVQWSISITSFWHDVHPAVLCCYTKCVQLYKYGMLVLPCGVMLPSIWWRNAVVVDSCSERNSSLFQQVKPLSNLLFGCWPFQGGSFLLYSSSLFYFFVVATCFIYLKESISSLLSCL